MKLTWGIIPERPFITRDTKELHCATFATLSHVWAQLSGNFEQTLQLFANYDVFLKIVKFFDFLILATFFSKSMRMLKITENRNHFPIKGPTFLKNKLRNFATFQNFDCKFLQKILQLFRIPYYHLCLDAKKYLFNLWVIIM